MQLSVVTTLYRSAPFVAEFYRRCVNATKSITNDFEIVFVNDGSPDDSVDLAIELHEQDARVVVVDLSRNFGHHRAMMAGLQHARGDLVFLLDVDLEEQPEDLQSFYRTMLREDCDVVFGVQAVRRGNIFERLSGNLFYTVFHWLSDLPIPRNLTTMRLMTRRYVDSLLEHQEREMIISGLWLLTGYKQVPQSVTKRSRTHKSNYGIASRIKFAVDHITAFSSGLLYKVFYAGVIIFVISFVCVAYFSSRYIITGAALAGWTSLAASIWMFGGLQTLLIGLVGIYVAHIFRETKNRPYVIVRHLYRRTELSNGRVKEESADAARV